MVYVGFQARPFARLWILLFPCKLVFFPPFVGSQITDFPTKTWNTEVLGRIGSAIGTTRVRVPGNLLCIADGIQVYNLSDAACPKFVAERGRGE